MADEGVTCPICRKNFKPRSINKHVVRTHEIPEIYDFLLRTQRRNTLDNPTNKFGLDKQNYEKLKDKVESLRDYIRRQRFNDFEGFPMSDEEHDKLMDDMLMHEDLLGSEHGALLMSEDEGKNDSDIGSDNGSDFDASIFDNPTEGSGRVHPINRKFLPFF
jgi:hypothetical protein